MVNPTQILLKASTTVSKIAIVKAFTGLQDPRRRAGQRHTLPLCLALFTRSDRPKWECRS